MKYAVIQSGGKQYQVHEGEVLLVEKLAASVSPIVFDQVLLVVDGDKIELGTPILPNLKVYASLVSEVKGTKIEVFKFKSKSRYRKHTGHRQKYTQIKIESIGEAPKPVKAVKVAKPVKAVKPKAVAKKKAPIKTSLAK